MAQIRQYESNRAVEGLRPDDSGISAYERAGRQIGASYHQAGEQIGGAIAKFGDQVDQHDTMAEISQGAANLAKLQDDLTTSWNQTAKGADPNDPDTAKKWRDSVLEPALDKYNSGFSTKQSQMWATEQVDHLRQHLFEKTAADQSSLAGDALVSNLNTLQAHASNIVRNDPSSIDAVHGMVDNSVNAMVGATPNLSADTASKARTEITDKIHAEVAQSAVIGAADMNPDQARSLLNSSSITDHLDGSQVKTLGTYIDSQQRASLSAQKAQEEEVRRAEKEDADKFANAVTASTIQPDGSVAIPKDYFANTAKLAFMPGVEPGLPRAMIDYGHSVLEQQSKGQPAITDPHVYADFQRRASLSPSDPNALTLTDVYKAGADKTLNQHDFEMYKGWVQEAGKNPQRVANQKMLTQFFGGYKQYITKSNMLNNDAQGNQRFLEFQQTMQQRFDNGVASGDKPMDLLSPSSPKFIAKDIGRFQMTQQQGLDATVQQATGVVKPLAPVGKVRYTPGQSLDDLDKQLSGGK